MITTSLGILHVDSVESLHPIHPQIKSPFNLEIGPALIAKISISLEIPNVENANTLQAFRRILNFNLEIGPALIAKISISLEIPNVESARPQTLQTPRIILNPNFVLEIGSARIAKISISLEIPNVENVLHSSNHKTHIQSLTLHGSLETGYALDVRISTSRRIRNAENVTQLSQNMGIGIVLLATT